MKKKLLTALLGFTAAASCAFGLAACDESGKINKDTVDMDCIITDGSATMDVKSAYATALELGYTGTLQEFIESLRGADGVDGTDGKDGADGKDGTDGKDGVDGKDGINGTDGKDGIGIKNIERSDDGNIVVTLTDGRTVSFAAIAPCSHEFGETEVYEATCTSIGYELRECGLCGYKDYVFIPEKGHKWDSGITLIKPDCTESGLEFFACTECRTNKTEEIAPTGHEFIDGLCKDCGITEFSEGLEFTLNADGTGYILSGIGTCTDTDLRIPETYEGLPVTEIAPRLFYQNKTIKSVSIPRYITKIGVAAFAYCDSLERIYFNAENCSVPKYFGFVECGKDKGIKVIIGNAVQHVPALIFSGTSGRNVTSVVFEEGSVCKSIGENAFFNSAIREIKIPDSVKVIEKYAFYSCSSLKSVDLGNGVEEIRESAFGQCESLENFIMSDNIKKIDYLWVDGSTREKLYNVKDNLCYIGSASNPYLVLMDVTDEKLETYKINSNTKIIYDYAFDWCTSLKYIDIPEGVTYIGSMFGYCHNLKELHIPASVTYIRGGINQAYALNKLSVDKDNPEYYEKDGCIIERATKTIIQGCNTSVIPSDGSVTAIGDYAFYTIRSANFVNLVIPESITSIGDGAFSFCYNLESVTLPKNLTYLGNYAFRDCKNLKSIELPAGITKTGQQTFLGCTAIESVILHEGLTTIEDGAFQNLKNLKSITLPASVTRIESYSFARCDSLESIVIPKSVKSIADAFRNCNSLNAIFFEGTREEWEKIYFDAGSLPENVTVYFYTEVKPDKGWHYVDGEIVFW